MESLPNFSLASVVIMHKDIDSVAILKVYLHRGCGTHSPITVDVAVSNTVNVCDPVFQSSNA